MMDRPQFPGRPRRAHATRVMVAATVALALCSLLPAPAAQAAPRGDGRDWNRGGDTLTGAVGLHYGAIGGTGLSFRMPLQWYLYAQAAGGIWHSGDDQRHNLGLQLHYLLRQDSHLRLFTSVGTGFYYHRQRVEGALDADAFTAKTDWNYGAGVGVEVLQGPRWAWLAEFDFVHEERTGNTTVAPQLGVHYYW